MGGCPVGDARPTGGHRLHARWVIHAVGPVWRGGRSGEDELLASAYRSSLSLAEDCGAASVAFPLIGTGAYGFPMARACRIAVREIDSFLAGGRRIGRVLVVCLDGHAHAVPEGGLTRVRGQRLLTPSRSSSEAGDDLLLPTFP